MIISHSIEYKNKGDAYWTNSPFIFGGTLDECLQFIEDARKRGKRTDFRVVEITIERKVAAESIYVEPETSHEPRP